MPILPIYVTAFVGDGARLEATLAALKASLPVALLPVTVLGADDPELQAVTVEAGQHFRAVLAPDCDELRYWSTVLPVLQELQGEQGQQARLAAAETSSPSYLDAINSDLSSPAWIIRAGTALPQDWHTRLLDAGTENTPAPLMVFPLSVRHPCTSIYSDTAHSPSLSVQQIDDWLNTYVPGRSFDVPLFSGWTALVRLTTLPALIDGPQCSDETLAEACRDQGSLLLASDALFVDDRDLPAQTLPQDMYRGWRDAFTLRHPLANLRHAQGELSERSEAPPANQPRARPVRLHTTHGWGGGLWRWAEDYIEADGVGDNLILRPIGDLSAFSQVIALYDSMHGEPLARWTLAQPILSTELHHAEYQSILQSVIRDYGVRHIIVSSVIGHALDLLDTGLPTTIVCHDFYPLCPPILATWDQPCLHCDNERMQACLKVNPWHRFFEYEPVSHFEAVRQRYVALIRQHHISMVAPTPGVAARWQSLAPALQDTPINVIPHGLPVALLAALAEARQRAERSGERLRILALGGLDYHKGGYLLEAIVDQVTEFADLILLGCGDGGKPFEKKKGVQVIRRYDRDQLGHLLAQHVPDLGLLLSTVPETFSYTLSELQGAGIPVVATKLGAFADRIVPEQNGWLIEPNSESLLTMLQSLHANPERIDKVRGGLCATQARSNEEMVAEYEMLFYQRHPLRRITRPLPIRLQLAEASQVRQAASLLYISPEASYREALNGFLEYTQNKLSASPRLPLFMRRVLGRLLRLLKR